MKVIKILGVIAAIIFVIDLWIIGSAYSDDFHIVNLNELSLDYKNYHVVNPNAHNMLIWPNVPKEGVNVGIKLDLFKYLYWDSTIESLTDDAQYASIGLETRLGVRVSDSLELGFYHHSQHVLDSQYTYMNGHFPEEDAVEVKLYLYKEKGQRPGVIK